MAGRGGCAGDDAELAAGDGVHDRTVGGAVVGDDSLDRDSVPAVEGDRAAQEGDGRRGRLVGEYLGIGEPAVVVDRDVDVLPTDTALSRPASWAASGDAMARLAESSETFDVDVHEFTEASTLVAIRRLRRLEARQPVQPQSDQDCTNGRDRHSELRRDAR